MCKSYKKTMTTSINIHIANNKTWINILRATSWNLQNKALFKCHRWFSVAVSIKLRSFKCESYFKNSEDLISLLCQTLHQPSMNLLKARSLFGVSSPAAQHEIIVEPIGTSVRLWQVHLGPLGWGMDKHNHLWMTHKREERIWKREPLWSPHLLSLVPEELASVFNDLLIRKMGVGLLLTQSQNLPHCHPKCPHVTCHCELSLRKHT